jgi:hypothetical protein
LFAKNQNRRRMRFSVPTTERIAGGCTVVDLATLEAMNAIWVAANYGRKEKLLVYLRSNKPLTARDRAYLADYLEGKIKRKKGRPHDLVRASYIIELASLVHERKRELREAGERYRIHDKAVDHALKIYNSLGYPVVAREKLENYLRRSKRRKK